MAITATGRSVTVMTTTRIVPDIGISISSGYPNKSNRKTVSTAFLGSSIPPKILPEFVKFAGMA